MFHNPRDTYAATKNATPIFPLVGCQIDISLCSNQERVFIITIDCRYTALLTCEDQLVPIRVIHFWILWICGCCFFFFACAIEWGDEQGEEYKYISRGH